MIAPCKDCADRTIGCHSTCVKYIDWQKWYTQQKALAKERETPLLNEYSFSFPAGKKYCRRR